MSTGCQKDRNIERQKEWTAKEPALVKFITIFLAYLVPHFILSCHSGSGTTMATSLNFVIERGDRRFDWRHTQPSDRSDIAGLSTSHCHDLLND